MQRRHSTTVLKDYSDVFDGLGQIPGEYTIQTNLDIPPTVQPPHRIPVPLKQTVKAELESMTKKGIIAPVIEPTKWVSSMVVVQKDTCVSRSQESQSSYYA